MNLNNWKKGSLIIIAVFLIMTIGCGGGGPKPPANQIILIRVIVSDRDNQQPIEGVLIKARLEIRSRSRQTVDYQGQGLTNDQGQADIAITVPKSLVVERVALECSKAGFKNQSAILPVINQQATSQIILESQPPETVEVQVSGGVKTVTLVSRQPILLGSAVVVLTALEQEDQETLTDSQGSYYFELTVEVNKLPLTVRLSVSRDGFDRPTIDQSVSLGQTEIKQDFDLVWSTMMTVKPQEDWHGHIGDELTLTVENFFGEVSWTVEPETLGTIIVNDDQATLTANRQGQGTITASDDLEQKVSVNLDIQPKPPWWHGVEIKKLELKPTTQQMAMPTPHGGWGQSQGHTVFRSDGMLVHLWGRYVIVWDPDGGAVKLIIDFWEITPPDRNERPTDVATDSQGNIFVLLGDMHSGQYYIVKFDLGGERVKEVKVNHDYMYVDRSSDEVWMLNYGRRYDNDLVLKDDYRWSVEQRDINSSVDAQTRSVFYLTDGDPQTGDFGGLHRIDIDSGEDILLIRDPGDQGGWNPLFEDFAYLPDVGQFVIYAFADHDGTVFNLWQYGASGVLLFETPKTHLFTDYGSYVDIDPDGNYWTDVRWELVQP